MCKKKSCINCSFFSRLHTETKISQEDRKKIKSKNLEVSNKDFKCYYDYRPLLNSKKEINVFKEFRQLTVKKSTEEITIKDFQEFIDKNINLNGLVDLKKLLEKLENELEIIFSDTKCKKQYFEMIDDSFDLLTLEKIKENKKQKKENSQFIMNIWTFWIVILGVIISLIGIFK